MSAPDPRLQPALTGMRVTVGPRYQVTLCHRVCLVPRVGQVWHFIKPRHGYVLAVLDVEGRTRYSIIQDVRAFLTHLGLPVTNLGLDPANLGVIIGIDWAKEGADSWQAGSGWAGPPPGSNPLDVFLQIAAMMKGSIFGAELPPRHEFATSFGTTDCAICALPEDHEIHD